MCYFDNKYRVYIRFNGSLHSSKYSDLSVSPNMPCFQSYKLLPVSICGQHRDTCNLCGLRLCCLPQCRRGPSLLFLIMPGKTPALGALAWLCTFYEAFCVPSPASFLSWISSISSAMPPGACELVHAISCWCPKSYRFWSMSILLCSE